MQDVFCFRLCFFFSFFKNAVEFRKLAPEIRIVEKNRVSLLLAELFYVPVIALYFFVIQFHLHGFFFAAQFQKISEIKICFFGACAEKIAHTGAIGFRKLRVEAHQIIGGSREFDHVINPPSLGSELIADFIDKPFVGQSLAAKIVTPGVSEKNVVLEKETGSLVCALDEVGESSGPGYEEKKKKVLDRNRRQDGGTLKYGFLPEKDKNGENKLTLGRVRNIPLFYLALPDEFVKKGIRELIPSLKESSDYERNLFSYFMESLSAQIKFFQLGRESLNPVLKDRLKHFEKTVKKFR